MTGGAVWVMPEEYIHARLDRNNCKNSFKFNDFRVGTRLGVVVGTGGLTPEGEEP